MNKQEVIEKLKEYGAWCTECHDTNGEKDRYVKVAKVRELLEKLDQPQKVKVPEEFDEWFLQIKQKWCKAAEQFALWKICQFGFGHYFEDVSHERTPPDLSVWVSNHQDEAVHAILNGYEVEEERKYCVKIGGLYLKEPLGDTNDFTINMTWNKDYAYLFDSWNMAREHTSKLGGTAEKV